MKTIVELINGNTGWLYVKILETPFFFLDFWSFTHLWSGGVILAIITAAKWKHRWALLFTFLMMYEVIEISILFSALNIFKPEIIKDQFTDIFVGMVGGYLVDRWLSFFYADKVKHESFLKGTKLHIALFTATTISFIWVGFYKYEYNVAALNTHGLNIGTFIFWLLGILGTLTVYEGLNKKFTRRQSIYLLWVIYFVGLCVVESISFHIIGLKETGPHVHKPLVLNIIHGSPVMHVFYMLIPFISVIFYSVFSKLFGRAFETKNSIAVLHIEEKYNKIDQGKVSCEPAQNELSGDSVS